MRNCRSARPAGPNVRPKGKRTWTARGTPILATISGKWMTETVVRPLRSSSRCASPTDWWHVHQPGESTTTSTSCDVKTSRTRGMVSATSGVGSGM